VLVGGKRAFEVALGNAVLVDITMVHTAQNWSDASIMPSPGAPVVN
jgi:hypothetical protein